MADIPSLGFWGDPRVWIAAAVVLIILTIIMIYYEVFTGEKRP